MKTWFILSMVVIGARHVPQLCVDMLHLKRRKVAERRTWARGLLIILLYVVILVVCCTSISVDPKPPSIAFWIGIVCIWTGAGFGFASFIQLRRSYAFKISLCDEFRLITSGVYGITRHPMRLGLAVETLGLVLVSGVALLLVPWAGIVILHVARTRHEEQFLLEHLGEAYRTYQEKVSAWNPIATLFRRVCKQR